MSGKCTAAAQQYVNEAAERGRVKQHSRHCSAAVQLLSLSLPLSPYAWYHRSRELDAVSRLMYTHETVTAVPRTEYSTKSTA